MTMRLFVAVNFSDDTRARLRTLCNALRVCAERGNFTLPENLHLTLAFLGECDEAQQLTAKQAVSTIGFEPFTITLAGGGYLDRGRANMVFCELKNDSGKSKLRLLQSELSENLSSKGFRPDRRKFWPHITLGREVVWKDAGAYSGFVEFHFPTIEETVTGIDLMKSEWIGGKLTYTSIFRKQA